MNSNFILVFLVILATSTIIQGQSIFKKFDNHPLQRYSDEDAEKRIAYIKHDDMHYVVSLHGDIRISLELDEIDESGNVSSSTSIGHFGVLGCSILCEPSILDAVCYLCI